MKRNGAVLVFKPGTTPREAANALKKIAKVLDVPAESMTTVPCGTRKVRIGGEMVEKKVVSMGSKAFEFVDMIREFDDEWGGPVWYIP